MSHALHLDKLIRDSASDALVIGHGSYFFPRGHEPHDIDLIIISENFEESFGQSRTLLEGAEFDIIYTRKAGVTARMSAEGALGYQHFSRALTLSTLLKGNNDQYVELVESARAQLASDPRCAAIGYAVDQGRRLSLVYRDMARAPKSERTAFYPYLFDSLIGLLFFNLAEWRSPPSCQRLWSEDARSVSELYYTALRDALLGRDESLTSAVNFELQRTASYLKLYGLNSQIAPV